MCNNTETESPLLSGRRCQLASRNILLIFFRSKRKAFHFTPHLPVPPRTKATRGREQRLLPFPCCARPRRFLCPGPWLNDSSAFPFSKSPFPRARVDSFLLAAGSGLGDAASDEAALTGAVAGPPAHPWRARSACMRLGKGTM